MIETLEQIQTSQITIEELSNSKIYKAGSGIQFPSPIEIIEPIFNSLSKLNGNCKYEVKIGERVENANEDGSINTAFSRWGVEFTLPPIYDPILADLADSSTSKLGLLVALDTQKPIVKVYSGKRVSSCTNMTVFNADNIHTEDLLGGELERIYKKAQSYLEGIEKDNEEYVRTITMLKTMFYKNEALHERIGYLLEKGIKNRVGDSSLFGGIKNLYDKGNRYYVPEDKEVNNWHIFNAITYDITNSSSNKRFLEEPDKVIKLAKLFLN